MISLRRRLLVGLLTLVVTVDGGAAALSYRRALQSTGTMLDYQLRQMALSLRDQGASTPRVHIPAEDRDFDFVAQIWATDGSSIYASQPDLPFARDVPLGYNDLPGNEESWRAFGLQTAQRVILVAQPWRVRERLAGQVALRTLAPLLIVTPLLAIAVGWIVLRTLAPIRRVADEVQKRGAESLSPIPSGGLPEEIEPLISALNRLMDRLGAALEAQRAFIADAAHELRSPLTALRLQLQLLDRAQDTQARGDARAKLGRAVERATALIQQLLTLARNETQAASMSLEPLELEDAVREGVADCASLALARNIELELQANGGLAVRGNRESLRVMVRNLVDNAVRYTPEGGRVLVRISRVSEGAELAVEDSGPGLDPGARERAFARFHRGADLGEEGSGLGLAIVKAVVDRHGAQIRLGVSSLGGLSVTVCVPVARNLSTV